MTLQIVVQQLLPHQSPMLRQTTSATSLRRSQILVLSFIFRNVNLSKQLRLRRLSPVRRHARRIGSPAHHAGGNVTQSVPLQLLYRQLIWFRRCVSPSCCAACCLQGWWKLARLICMLTRSDSKEVFGWAWSMVVQRRDRPSACGPLQRVYTFPTMV